MKDTSTKKYIPIIDPPPIEKLSIPERFALMFGHPKEKMPCKNCKEVIDPDLPFADLDYVPNKPFPKQSYVRIPYKPRKGWGVVLPLKGTPTHIDGASPLEVAKAAKKLFHLNGFNLDNNTLWFNLNIQWLQRTYPKYHERPLTELLEAANAQEIVSEDSHANKKVSPDSWTNSFWEFIKSYTYSETYQWELFNIFLKEYRKMLNPAENALLGNAIWYSRFTLALDKVERNPAYTGEAARKWIADEIQV